HAPAEAVGFGAHACMDRPARRDHHLFVRDHNMAGGLRRPHQVHHALVRFDVEVKVHLGAPHVRVGRHGVPVTARRQNRETHYQLATLCALAMDGLVYLALVAGFERTKLYRLDLSYLHQLRRMNAMRRIAEQVEIGWLVGGSTGKRHGLVAAPDVEAIHLIDLEYCTIDRHRSRAADVEDSKLAALQKIIRAE